MSDERRAHIAERLVTLREARGMSHRQLSFKADVSEKTLSRLENAEADARPSTLRRLAEALDVPVDELLPAAELQPGALRQLLERLDSIERTLGHMMDRLGDEGAERPATGSAEQVDLTAIRRHVAELTKALDEASDDDAGTARSGAQALGRSGSRSRRPRAQ